MNKTLLLLLLISCTLGLHGQIMITEIMYNPPEAGADSLEYIELYNVGSSSFDLTGSNFSAGIIYTFNGVTIPANGYVCVAVDSIAMQTVFGVACYQWNMNEGLRNGGELVQIKDANGNILDEVEFGNNTPWPSAANGTNGNGASIVLCDYNADNNQGSNWSAALNNIGVEIDGKAVKGSPMADNVVSCVEIPDYIVNATPNNIFSPRDITINVGEVVQWRNVGGGFHNVNGDKSIYPDNPVSFGNGAASTDDWTYNFTFFDEGVYEYQCDPHVGLDMKGTITVGQPKNYQKVAIGSLRSVNSEGLADNKGEAYEIEGVVHGVNYNNGSGVLFFVIDESQDGISIFNNNNNLGYTVVEGDLVNIKGVLDQFGGLTQINAEVINKIGTGDLQTAIVTDMLGEDLESNLVKINNLTLINPTQWRGDGSSFNVDASNGTDTFTIRVATQTTLSSQVAPTKPFNMTGLVNQFDFDAPLFDNYQLLPRYKEDLQESSNTLENAEFNIDLFPNPTSGDLTIESDISIDQMCLYHMDGRLLQVWENSPEQVELAQPAGMYILSFTKGQKSIYKKISIIK